MACVGAAVRVLNLIHAHIDFLDAVADFESAMLLSRISRIQTVVVIFHNDDAN